jgi:hypothetical protein
MVFVITLRGYDNDSQINLRFNLYIREGASLREQQFREFDTMSSKSGFNMLTASTAM